jgi:oligopeptide transport system substrate-binding protein
MSPRLVPGRQAHPSRCLPARFCFAVLVIATLVGCGRRESLVEASLKTATLHHGNGAEPQELDPHLTTGSTEGAIQGTLFEGLAILHPRTGQPIPAAASGWESSPDGRVVTFQLRPDGRWSDGVAGTAEDFVRSFQRLLTPTLGADFATEFYFIQGARQFHESKTKDFSTVGGPTPTTIGSWPPPPQSPPVGSHFAPRWRRTSPA